MSESPLRVSDSDSPDEVQATFRTPRHKLLPTERDEIKNKFDPLQRATLLKDHVEEAAEKDPSFKEMMTKIQTRESFESITPVIKLIQASYRSIKRNEHLRAQRKGTKK